jgi:hypothetical protein
MLGQVKAVLNFSAFRPEPDDPSASWRSRFPKKTTALLHVGRNRLDYCLVDAKGEVTPGEEKDGDYKEVFKELGPVIKSSSHDGWCAVSLDTRHVISIETNLSRKKGSEEALRKEPRSVLHARYEKGKRYAVTHNPETNSSLLLAMDEENIKKVEGFCKEQQLKIGRMCCGTYVLLRHALAATNTKKGSEAPFSALYIICCQGSVCALLQEKDNWMELRSRPDLFTDDLQPFLELLTPFGERLSPGASVVLACDEPVEGLPEKVAALFPGNPLNDLTEPGLLAKILHKR